jgi:hypothetical protein
VWHAAYRHLNPCFSLFSSQLTTQQLGNSEAGMPNLNPILSYSTTPFSEGKWKMERMYVPVALLANDLGDRELANVTMVTAVTIELTSYHVTINP